MNSVTLKKHHDISAFASCDSSRYVINGVFINPSDGVIAATDGRQLIEVPMGEPDEVPGWLFESLPKEEVKPFILPAKCVKSALSGSAFVNVAISGKKAIMQGIRENRESIQSSDIVEGDYPKYLSLFDNSKPDRHVFLSARFLKILADYAAKNSDKGVKIGFSGELSPVTFEITLRNGQKARALIMPMRES